MLKDQYPISTNKDIEVELIDISGANNNTELGLLNWLTELAPGESKKYRVSYSVKIPQRQSGQCKLNIPCRLVRRLLPVTKVGHSAALHPPGGRVTHLKGAKPNTTSLVDHLPAGNTKLL